MHGRSSTCRRGFRDLCRRRCRSQLPTVLCSRQRCALAGANGALGARFSASASLVDAEACIRRSSPIYGSIHYLAFALVRCRKGQRKRVMLAIGILAPQTSARHRRAIRRPRPAAEPGTEATLRKHVARGRTLFLSIHQIADAARICDRFVLLSNGNLVGEGTLETLSLHGGATRGTPARP